MSRRSPRDLYDLAVGDLRHNGGRRLRASIRARARRLRGRFVRHFRSPIGPIYAVAFGPNGALTLDTLLSRAPNGDLPLMLGGSPNSSSRIVHLDRASIRRFCELLLTTCPEQTFYVRTETTAAERLDERAVDRLMWLDRSFDLLVVERTVGAEPRHVQCSRIGVAVWAPGAGPYAEPFFQSDRQFSLVGRVTPPTMAKLTLEHHDFDQDHPAPDQPQFPIDVVYTWVDGADPAWNEQKERFATARQLGVSRNADDERFRSRDELRYSLRSLELFAPWVRKIHIVTADQCPDWLDTSHPKINLVSHREIYRDPAWLPTFNSSGIETQLHHVPDLAEKFLYFNDDFLLGQLTDPADFFFSNGVLKFFPSSQRAYEPDISASSSEYLQADRNAVELLKPMMPEVGRSIMLHVPYPSDRHLLTEIERRWADEFAACASARFRSPHDLRPIAFMQYHYGYHSGRALPSTITHRYLALWKPAILAQLAAADLARASKTVCINDVGLQPARAAEVNRAVTSFLESYYPGPSQFERTPAHSGSG